MLPFTRVRGLSDRLARRIARNTQLVLLEESSLAKVADPSAGSGGLEDLTEKLCAAAWAQLQEIELTGGAWAAPFMAAIEPWLVPRRKTGPGAFSWATRTKSMTKAAYPGELRKPLRFA